MSTDESNETQAVYELPLLSPEDMLALITGLLFIGLHGNQPPTEFSIMKGHQYDDVRISETGLLRATAEARMAMLIAKKIWCASRYEMDTNPEDGDDERIEKIWKGGKE